MMQGSDNQPIQLPDRQAITLCEAVTAFCYRKACSAPALMIYGLLNQAGKAEGRELSIEERLYGEAPTEEQNDKEVELVERLQRAAYAGRIKFRALKNGEYPAGGHKDIDPLYFSQQRGFRWVCDEIWSHPSLVSEPPHFTEDWHDVHLDREQFEALLQEWGVSVQQSPDAADVEGGRKTYRTGAAGHPTSIHLVMKEARRRLDAGDYPEFLTTFSEELANWLKVTEPEAAPMTAKTIRNNSELRSLWRRRPPRIIDPS